MWRGAKTYVLFYSRVPLTPLLLLLLLLGIPTFLIDATLSEGLLQYEVHFGDIVLQKKIL